MRRRGLWFALAVALQLVLLLGLIGRHSYTLATGTEVTLKSEPFDPWDPLKGQYVRLQYNISTFQWSDTSGSEAPFQSGQAVWVTLREGAPFWTVAAVSKERPAPEVGSLPVRARVQWIQWWTGPEPIPPEFHQGQVNLAYGVEEFYVPEGQGPKLEKQREGLTVKVKVDRFGQMALHQVLVNGQPLKWQ